MFGLKNCFRQVQLKVAVAVNRTASPIGQQAVAQFNCATRCCRSISAKEKFITEQKQLVIFDSGTWQVEMLLHGDTVWLSQEQMTALFGRERPVITKHIRNVCSEGELEQETVCANFAHTQRYCNKPRPCRQVGQCHADRLFGLFEMNNRGFIHLC